MKIKIPSAKNIVLLGGGSFLLSLAKWCKSEDIPIIVLTSPRHIDEIVEDYHSLGKKLDELSISYLVTNDIGSDKSKKFIGNISDSFCLSLGAAWIFKEEIINSLFKKRLFNLHGTRLPQNRGGGGFSWQIMMGNRLGFCQLHLVDSGIDTGDLIKTKEFLYSYECRTPIDYENVYQIENFKFITEFIKDLIKDDLELETIKQSEYLSSYWPRLSTEDQAWIDWNDEILSLERFICAFDDPYEGCKTFLNGKKVFIKSVISDFGDQSFHNFQSGIIYRKGPSWLSVCSNGGTLIIKSVLNEDGENILHKIQVGDRFVTPKNYIDSRYNRVIYTPTGKKKNP
jgi:methionyl-tRNA formyltransferase